MKKDILAAIDEALAVGGRLCDIEDKIFDEGQYVLLLEKTLIQMIGVDWNPEDEDVIAIAESSAEAAFHSWKLVESCWNCSAGFSTWEMEKYKLGMCRNCYEYGWEMDDDPTEHFTQYGEVDGIPIMRSSQYYKHHMFVLIGEGNPLVS